MPPATSQSPSERWIALLVRYWSYNMTLVHQKRGVWPGFGYSETEKAELAAIAETVPRKEYSVWIGVTVVLALIIFGGVVIAGMNCLLYAIGGEQNMANTPAPLFFLMLGLDLLVCLAGGFPAAMLLGAAIAGGLNHIPDSALPDRARTAHYFHKLWFQITRVAIVILFVLVPLWMFVPADSKFVAIGRLIVPLLSPAVGVLTAAYYYAARLRSTRDGL